RRLETSRPRAAPQNAGLSQPFWKSLVQGECVVADAVPCEPVSTVKFPAIRENNREFCKIAARRPLPGQLFRRRIKDLPTISLLYRAGNFQNGNREFSTTDQGNSSLKPSCYGYRFRPTANRSKASSKPGPSSSDWSARSSVIERPLACHNV